MLNHKKNYSKTFSNTQKQNKKVVIRSITKGNVLLQFCGINSKIISNNRSEQI